MTSIKTIAVAGFLPVMAVAPAFAQAAIQEPGLFSFYHPNLDVLNDGAPTPAYRLESFAAFGDGSPCAEGKWDGQYRLLAPSSKSSRGRHEP